MSLAHIFSQLKVNVDRNARSFASREMLIYRRARYPGRSEVSEATLSVVSVSGKILTRASAS